MSADLHDLRRGAPPHAARLLVAIPYRQAGLVALCALVGAGATLGVSALRPPTHASAQVQRARPVPIREPFRLLLDMEPDPRVAEDEAANSLAIAASSSASGLRLDDSSELEAFEDALRANPPAAGPPPMVIAGRAVPRDGVSATWGWRGLFAGLLLGLLLAGLRELRGGRMRTPREAEWALGVPVLGAIPTLSAKALAAGAGRPARPADAATRPA